MAEAKVTTMLIKADLHCDRCCKKVKKLLCRYSEIRNQVFDEKQNTVIITVICCSPERIRDKLICKGGKTIKSIEIVVPKKPDPPPKPKSADEKTKAAEAKPKPEEKPKSADPKPVEKPKEDPKPDPPKEKPKDTGKNEAAKPVPGTKPASGPGPEQVKIPPPVSYPVPGHPPAVPVEACCMECYQGYGGGPCYQGYGMPQLPRPCYGGYGRPPPCQGGYVVLQRGYYGNRCEYFSEENPSSCVVM